MSFFVKYPNRKDWRKPGKGAARWTYSCRPHGRCSYCGGNRRIREKREMARTDQLMREWFGMESGPWM